ncbi:MAG: hypothetical protein GY932_14785, partial [Arcobacter sp.]|nr:hypothetical protein [Arcobacter sp.]
LLEKVLDAFPGIPTLEQVLAIANRHEATKKDSRMVKMESSGAFAIRQADSSDSGEEGGSSSDDSPPEMLFVAKKKGTGKNRNYIHRPEKEKYVKAPSKSDQSARAISPKSCSYCGGMSHKSNQRKECPANGKKCDYCGRYNHVEWVCLKRIKETGRSLVASTSAADRHENDSHINSVRGEEK